MSAAERHAGYARAVEDAVEATTAAERATEAEQGAAEHRGEQLLDITARLIADAMSPHDLRAALAAPQEGVLADPRVRKYMTDRLAAIDAGIPAGDLYHGLPEDEALALADQGAREQAVEERYGLRLGSRSPSRSQERRHAIQDAAQPPALVLPDGWERFTDLTGVTYYRSPGIDRLPYLYVDVEGISHGRFTSAVAAEARALAARLVEAAAIVEQLRGGAR